MATSVDDRFSNRRVSVLSVLVLAAFIAPGAWMVKGLPPVAWSQFLQIATVAVWLVAAGLGVIALRRPHRSVVLAAIVFGVIALVATLANPYPFAAFFYDIYGEMPALQWFVLLGMFLVGASVPTDARVVRGLQAVVIASVALSVFAIWWSTLPIIGGDSVVFGSSAYSVPALAPVMVVAIALARLDRKHRFIWWGSAAIIVFTVGVSLGSMMGSLAVVFAVAAMLAFEPTLLGVPVRLERTASIVGVTAAAIAVAAIMFASSPAVSGGLLPESEAQRWPGSVATRIHLYNGAERMVAERPLLGYGAGGYRLRAVEFLDKDVFPSIATLGADPISYSPPSPHSLLWEVLTRSGGLGLLAFFTLVILGYITFRERAAQEGDERHARFRNALAAAAAVYLFTLLTTPTHFASGLLGPLMCGLAIAPAPRGVESAEEAVSRGALLRAVLVLLGVALAGIGLWLGIGKSSGTLGSPDLATLIDRADAAAAITPGDPLNERHRLELALIAAKTPEEIRAVQERIDHAPGYIVDYLPNHALWSYIGLSEIDRGNGMTPEWERANLELAARTIPDVPSVVAESMHLALVENDVAAIRSLVAPVRELVEVYPESAAYLERAEAVLAETP